MGGRFVMGLLGKLRPEPRCTVCARTMVSCCCQRSPAKAIKRQPPVERKKKR